VQLGERMGGARNAGAMRLVSAKLLRLAIAIPVEEVRNNGCLGDGPGTFRAAAFFTKRF